MKRRDLGELAFRNLREAVLRNSLTTLGIAVGVASLVAMLSLGVGLQNLATDRLSRSGLFDAIFVAPKSNNPTFGRPRNEIPEPTGPPKPLDAEARKKIEAVPNVTEVYPEIRFPTEIHYDGNPYHDGRGRRDAFGENRRLVRRHDRLVFLQPDRRRSDPANRFRAPAFAAAAE